MDTQTENLLDRLRQFYEKIVMNIVHVYFEREILDKTTSFYFFLHKHKHKLFHEYIPTVPCCQCQTGSQYKSTSKTGCLRESQFYVLYKCTTEDDSCQGKKIGTRRKEHCICKFDPKDVKVFQLDIILVSAIINTCCPQPLPANLKWIQKIKGVRNFLDHHGDASCLSKADFDDKWQILEKYSLLVANTTEESYMLGIRNRILSLKKENDVSFSLKEEFMNKLRNHTAVSEDTIGQINFQLDEIIFMLKISTFKYHLKPQKTIQFIYTGSLVIEITTSKIIVNNADALSADILSFLETFCKVTEINTNIGTLVDVEIFVTDVTLAEIPGTEKTGSSLGNCNTCYNRNVENAAYEWCINCQELYCSICASIHRATTCSAKHTIISVNSTSKHFPPNINLKTECKKHSKNLDFYCNIHKRIICIDCVRLNHYKCVDIVSIEKASINIKSSFWFVNTDTVVRKLELDIDHVLSGLLYDERNRKITKPDLESKILNTFQKSLSMEQAEVEVKPLTDLLFDYELSENACIQLTEIRNKSQTFIAIHKLTKDNNEVEKIFKETVDKLQEHNLHLELIDKYEFHDRIKKYETVQSKPIAQAGAQVHVSDIEHIRMSPTKSFVVNGIDINASARLTILGEYILIVHKNKIIFQNISGYFEHNITLQGTASDIAVINDKNVVVLLHNSIEKVNIMNKHTATVRKDPSETYRALSYFDKYLFVLSNFVIHITDLSGNIVKSFQNTETYQDNNYDPCIVAHDDQLFILSYSVESHLQCFDLNVKRLWHSIFKAMNLGVQMTIDSKGNLFIPSYYDESIGVLNIRDRFCKLMLTETTEFKSPRALYFDKGNCRIVALHGSHMCTVFDVSYM
ncbi:unnamed protein product [Mytilus coruscus]|uniref:B box-type domain-containing protein n=1 Tax=Mytilus coruscus TaxID=42192 RepID=A0A6J8AER5_MYTCO|nr:unnamed protein product [Mytilus coruscus]